MQEVGLSSLDPRLSKQVENARRAIDKGNPRYAIDICRGILKRSPGCLEVRQILRRAQRGAAQSDYSAFSKAFARVTNAPFRLKSRTLLKKDPVEALEAAETWLTANPSDTSAHRALAHAAEALDLPATTVFAYESILAEEPDNVANLLSLGNAYWAAGRNADAVKAGDRILSKDPANREAQALIKRASVSQSIDSGGWERAGDYRGILKDEQVAVELETENRAVGDEDTLRRLIEDAKTRIDAEPGKAKHYRDLIRALRKIGDLESALAWVEKYHSHPAAETDANFERDFLELMTEYLNKQIADRSAAVDANPEDRGAREALAEVVANLHRFQVDSLRALVEKYPNDFEFRFTYGECLFARGDLDEAASQFQLAQRSPALKVSATLNLGKVFERGGKFDHAAAQLESAREHSGIGGDLKKEITYELAHCFEKMGDPEKAIKEYKTVYASDVTYRDVADKINAYYA
jgi:tetratricopeptide (TPR) repeat protein